MTIKNEKLVYLLACIGEECGEVQQVVGKSLRFGVDNFNPKTDNVPNRELLRREIHDLIAVYNLYLEELGDSCKLDPVLLLAKSKKTMRYFDDYPS